MNQVPTRKKKRRKRKPKLHQQIQGTVRDLFDVYGLILKPAIVLVALIVIVYGGATWLDVNSSSLGGRNQKEFLGRTTHKWLELEAEGKARRAEGLWRDQRWMSLESVLGLDWAALPDLLNALRNSRTRSLAESTLGRYTTTPGAPEPTVIVDGLQSQDEHVRLWSARLASKLESADEEVTTLLKQLTEDQNEELRAAAEKSVNTLESK